MRRSTRPPKKSPAPQIAAAASASTAASRCSVLADGPGGRLGVQLIRVVEHRSLGRPSRLPVMVDGDRVQELAPDVGVELACPLLDQPQAEVNVAEQTTLLGLAKRRSAAQLARSPDIVQQRRRQQQIVA